MKITRSAAELVITGSKDDLVSYRVVGDSEWQTVTELVIKHNSPYSVEVMFGGKPLRIDPYTDKFTEASRTFNFILGTPNE